MSINSSACTFPQLRESKDWAVTMEKGVHWFLAPNGKKFYGCGVNGVDAGPPPERLEDGLLTTFGIYTLRLTFGQPTSASVSRNGGSIISESGVFVKKKSASLILPTSILGV